MSYRVYLVHFERHILPNGTPAPYHWEICIRLGKQGNKSVGNVYHLQGGEASFAFERIANTTYTKPDSYRGSLLVGTIPTSDLAAVENVLSNVPVRKNEPNWNCQNWCHDALRALSMRKYQVVAYELAMLRHLMQKDAFAAWNTGDDSD
ncbi:hypothetical protein AcW1_007010 [Taiwanofungus camphoratus]|nr:hypothetical protein AcV5_002811 [Antrodia cinnamomea]KAI0918030.1 hypothetical protein AcV5_002813 [Antrodia cinnamomea]KAI0925067.1 hypothetical protein AcW2_005762 [Antrodia cinnamomea]KAI0925069.1 hypothetical protein AcW2_005764 [Antrodia cinnamomea]KAI0929715.1 hypothetical protein AcV7_005184 [Antrodia cinnamomea]